MPREPFALALLRKLAEAGGRSGGSLGDGDFLLADELRSLRAPVGILWGRHHRFLPPHLEIPDELARALVAHQATDC